MIDVLLKNYCQCCPEIEAVTDSQILYADNEIMDVYTTIKCKHADRCEHIMKYLERRYKRKEEATDDENNS